jgi:hypothetical protein
MIIRNSLFAVCVSMLVGCVTVPVPKYQPTIATTQGLMQNIQAKIGVDRFDAAKDVNNTSLSMRGSQLTGGSDGTYTTYLHDAVQSALESAGRFDAASAMRLSGTLDANDLNGANMSTGTATISVRFVLTQKNATLYNKEVTANQQWPSSIIGAVAIPAAVQNYGATMEKLVGQLFSDPDFIKATNQGVPDGR